MALYGILITKDTKSDFEKACQTSKVNYTLIEEDTDVWQVIFEKSGDQEKVQKQLDNEKKLSNYIYPGVKNKLSTEYKTKRANDKIASIGV